MHKLHLVDRLYKATTESNENILFGILIILLLVAHSDIKGIFLLIAGIISGIVLCKLLRIFCSKWTKLCQKTLNHQQKKTKH